MIGLPRKGRLARPRLRRGGRVALVVLAVGAVIATVLFGRQVLELRAHAIHERRVAVRLADLNLSLQIERANVWRAIADPSLAQTLRRESGEQQRAQAATMTAIHALDPDREALQNAHELDRQVAEVHDVAQRVFVRIDSGNLVAAEALAAGDLETDAHRLRNLLSLRGALDLQDAETASATAAARTSRTALSGAFALGLFGLVFFDLLWARRRAAHAGEVEAAERAVLERMLDDAKEGAAAFESASIGMVVGDLTGRITRVNHAICQMLGYSAQELTATTIAALIHPEDRAASGDLLRQLATGQTRVANAERRYLTRDGGILLGRLQVTAIEGPDGHPDHVVAQVEDVTARHVAEQSLADAQLQVIERLALAGEYRDDVTGQHTRRVGELSLRIGAILEMPENELLLLRQAAPLHDVGKIAIPDSILLKPGRLTPDEFAQMQTHTTLGAAMLGGGAFPLLQMAEEIALTHHERWDGNGYPAGLSGPAIPLTGRIVAIADVFDALTHARPYKAAWTVADALTEIARQKGSQFDPTAVDAFLSIEQPDLVPTTHTKTVPPPLLAAA